MSGARNETAAGKRPAAVIAFQKQSDAKKNTPEPPGPLARFLGRRVAIKLTFGDEVAGTFHEMNRYEIVVLLPDGHETVVFKSAIATIREAVTS